MNRKRKFALYSIIIFLIAGVSLFQIFNTNEEVVLTCWGEGDYTTISVISIGERSDRRYFTLYPGDIGISHEEWTLTVTEFNIHVLIDGVDYSDTISPVIGHDVTTNIENVTIHVETIQESITYVNLREVVIILVLIPSIILLIYFNPYIYKYICEQ